MVTVTKMETQLQYKLKTIVDSLDQFLQQSEADLIEEESELVLLT